VLRNWKATKRYIAAFNPDLDCNDCDGPEKDDKKQVESLSKMFTVKNNDSAKRPVQHTDAEFMTEMH
jgi:hypothetical protein